MKLIKNKIYKQKDKLYGCIEDTINPVYDDLSSSALDRYIKLVE